MCVLPAVCNLDRYRAALHAGCLTLLRWGGTRLRDSAGISPDFPDSCSNARGGVPQGPVNQSGCSQAVRMGWLNGQPLRAPAGWDPHGAAGRASQRQRAWLRRLELGTGVGVGTGVGAVRPADLQRGTDLQRVYATLTSSWSRQKPAARSRVSPRTTSARCNGCRCVPSPPNSRIRAKAHRAVDHALFLEQGGLRTPSARRSAHTSPIHVPASACVGNVAELEPSG